jgi:hypothetical protein
VGAGKLGTNFFELYPFPIPMPVNHLVKMGIIYAVPLIPGNTFGDIERIKSQIDEKLREISPRGKLKRGRTESKEKYLTFKRVNEKMGTLKKPNLENAIKTIAGENLYKQGTPESEKKILAEEGKVRMQYKAVEKEFLLKKTKGKEPRKRKRESDDDHPRIAKGGARERKRDDRYFASMENETFGAEITPQNIFEAETPESILIKKSS